jgi:hypothetical protein
MKPGSQINLSLAGPAVAVHVLLQSRYLKTPG